MRLRSTIAILLLICVWSRAENRSTEIPSVTEVNSTVASSLPYIEAKGESWIAEQKCVTCHRVAMMTWSFSEAKQHGFAIDDEKLNQWIHWSVNQSLSIRPQDGLQVGSKNLEGLSQLILGRPKAPQEGLYREPDDAFVRLILEGQQTNGSWKPNGQLPSQKRSESETTAVSTIWILLALRSMAISTPEVRASEQKALTWLGDATPGKSNEWYVVQLLLGHALGDSSRREKSRGELLSKQNPDGGWGWTVGESSDALATGQSLYALSFSVDQPSEAVGRAWKFLVDTQREDGSWLVLGTKSEKKDQFEETSIYWGTTWAVIGLLHTLP